MTLKQLKLLLRKSNEFLLTHGNKNDILKNHLWKTT